MSDRTFERAVTDWLEDGSDGTPKHALDAVLLAVKTTPQERDLRIPWRLPMPAFTRSTAFAAVVLVAVVGVGGLIYLDRSAPSGVGAAPPPAPTQAPSASPGDSPSASPAAVAPDSTGWTPFTSTVYDYTLSYPQGWSATPAERTHQAGDTPERASTYSDEFGSVEADFAFGVFRLPAGNGADLASVDGLKAFAVTYCEAQSGLQGGPDCDTFADRAVSVCLPAGGDPCTTAIVLPSENKDPGEEGTYAFVPDASGTNVIVVVAYRGEGWPGAEPYGGTSGLLTSVLETMDVTPQ